MKTLEQLGRELDSGRTTAEALAAECLDRIADPRGEGSRAFLHVDPERVRARARAVDAMRAAGMAALPLAGIPISVKDLFDVAGEVTRAGSVVLADAAPAGQDAPVVARLRAAGMVLVGRTNMTEFAYSGVGMNPHYDTPRNAWDRQAQRIPGGSSSGAAVSVTDGMAAAGLGSDTGGSIRIPAALCGLAGFKPTASRIPLEGTVPLSFTLDSIGAVAPTVACCAAIDAVLAGEPVDVPGPLPLAGLRLGVLRDYVMEEIEDTVAQTFERTLARLGAAGARLQDVFFPELNDLATVNGKGGFAAAEAWAWHRELLERDGERYDPRVGRRIEAGSRQSAADYIDLLNARRRYIDCANAITAPLDALILPTVPIVTPTIESLAEDDAYFRANRLLLRNPAVFNFLDRCAASVPCHDAGEAPVGLMVVGENGGDRRLMAVARAVEGCVAPRK